MKTEFTTEKIKAIRMQMQFRGIIKDDKNLLP